MKKAGRDDLDVETHVESAYAVQVYAYAKITVTYTVDRLDSDTIYVDVYSSCLNSDVAVRWLTRLNSVFSGFS